MRRHVHRYAHRHVCRHLYRHVCRHGYMQTCARAQRRVEPRAPESSAACIMIYGSQHCAGTHSAHPVLFLFCSMHRASRRHRSCIRHDACGRHSACCGHGAAPALPGDATVIVSMSNHRRRRGCNRGRGDRSRPRPEIAAKGRGQRPLPRPRLTVNSSYRCDRDRGDFVDGVVPEFCCTAENQDAKNGRISPTGHPSGVLWQP